MTRKLSPTLFIFFLFLFSACFESSRISTPANSDPISETGGSSTFSGEAEDDSFGEFQIVSFGDDQNSAISYFTTASFRFLIASDTVLEGGYRTSSNYDFYFNDNHFDLILEVE